MLTTKNSSFRPSFTSHSSHSTYSTSDSTFSGSKIKSTYRAPSDALRLSVGYVERLGTLGLQRAGQKKTAKKGTVSSPISISTSEGLPDLDTFKGDCRKKRHNKKHTNIWHYPMMKYSWY